MSTQPFQATIVQFPPVYLNLTQSIEKACDLIADAAHDGAELIVFSETWLPGYPVWLDEVPGAALWGSPKTAAVYRQLVENSPALDDPAIEKLRRAAAAAKAVVVMGLNESYGNTLYNTILTIDANGTLANIHRKLMPTFTERLIWGQGDGSTLDVVETAVGRLGGLVCWEHWMPLARYAMHAQNELVHVAQWPTVKEMHMVASRNYAFEGQCFVMAAGTVLSKQDVANTGLLLLDEIPAGSPTLLQQGGSAIIAPNGDFLAGPLYDQTGFISAEIDPANQIDGHLTLDITGHYSRPDVFQLHVNRQANANVIWGNDK